MEYANIRIHADTLDKLKAIKVHPRETLDDIIIRLLVKKATER